MQVGIKIVDEKGTVRWYKDADCTILHKEDGPAVVYADGTKEWRQHGQVHRVDGPAIEWRNGSVEWWLNDTKLTEAEFLANVSKL